MRIISITSFIAVLLSGAFAGLDAQASPPIAPGTRVRVFILAPGLPAGKDIKMGTLVALSADTLLLKRVWGQPGLLAVSRASITQLEVSLGQKSNVDKYSVRGLLIGAGAGALLGAVIGNGFMCSGSGFFACPEKQTGTSMAVGAGVGGVLGFLIGTGIGAAKGDEPERWEEVPLEQIRVGVSPQRHDGVMLSASFAF